MLYQSLKLTNGIWILAELRIQPGNPNYTVEYNLVVIIVSTLSSCKPFRTMTCIRRLGSYSSVFQTEKVWVSSCNSVRSLCFFTAVSQVSGT